MSSTFKILNQQQLKRDMVFMRCESKEHLRMWIWTYLGLDYDFTVICDDDTRTPPSNSTPLDLLWEMYQSAIDGRDPTKTFYLAYASRDGYKTLTCAVLEVLCLFHLRRDVGHLAAVEGQAQNCTRYVENFLKRPILQDFLSSKNKRTIEVTRYEPLDDSGKALSLAEWELLSPVDQLNYKEEVNFIRILVATMSGTNSLHCSMLIFDELDLAPPKPVEEAKMIAAEGKERRELAITFMTSSRKTNFGLVQKAIDDAEKTGLIIRHWNLIDMARACPPTRHLPDQQKIPIYFSENTLKSFSQAEYESLPEEEREDLLLADGYQGCIKNCKLFAVCRGRLATKQTSTSKLLKSVDHVQSMFKVVEVETAKAQLMSWKPSTEGLIYPRFDKSIHMITARQMAERITGDKYPHQVQFTKNDLISLMKARGVKWAMGQDYGYSHCFAGVTSGIFGAMCFIVDAFEVPGLEIDQKIELCDKRIKHLNPATYGDTASPGDIKMFRKHGYRMIDWNKKAGTVQEGIDCVRAKLNPFSGPPQLYLLKGDEGCEQLGKRMSEYHWTLDAQGKVQDIPDDTDDDSMDAMRYLILNEFPITKRGISVSKDEPPKEGALSGGPQYSQKGWMKQVISEHVGGNPQTQADLEAMVAARGTRGRTGSFVWDIG